MASSNRATPIASFLEEEYKGERWFSEIQSYLEVRLPALEERMAASFRYVDVDSDNRHVFSYEFSSILNDSCRAFGSIMDKMLRSVNPSSGKSEYRVWDYYEFLDSVFKKRFHMFQGLDLTWVSLSVNHGNADGKCLMPFDGVVPQSSPMRWWSAHNSLKHSDIDNAREGDFQNAFDALAGVAFLNQQILGLRGRQTKLFRDVGVFLPPSRPKNAQIFFA